MYRALVADDEPLMLEGMRLMIEWEKHGFELAAVAATAQEALRLIDECKPDLLMTDVKMPGMLGTDLARLCAKHYPHLKLVFISGYHDFEYARTAIQTGVLGYLLKPIDPDEVHRMLSQVKLELDERSSGAVISLKNSHALRRVASGDNSAEALNRAAELLSVKEDTLCQCAALESDRLPQLESAGARQLLEGYGATAFNLRANRVGLCAVKRALDEELLTRVARADGDDQPPARIGVGRAHTGAEGFAESLREAQSALDAQYERKGALLCYQPYRERDAAWVAGADLPSLAAALQSGCESALEKWLEALYRWATKGEASRLALRLLAKQTELSLPSPDAVSALRALWREDADDTGAWLQRYADVLRRVAKPSAQPEAVRRALDIIREEYAKPLSITGLAGRLYLNPAYLGQLIKKTTGTSFNRHLLDTRLRRACALLRQTRMTIREIAAQVGIKDVSYFSTQFRRELDMSPNAYRGCAEGDKSE